VQVTGVLDAGVIEDGHRVLLDAAIGGYGGAREATILFCWGFGPVSFREHCVKREQDTYKDF
jgi:hypothetical protein